jgi:hypothetical protein
MRGKPASSGTRLLQGKLLCALTLLIAAAVIPSAAQKSSGTKFWQDPAVMEYSHDGLPCSTSSPQSFPSSSKSQAPLQQLDQIERQSLKLFKDTSERPNKTTPLYKPISKSSTESSINFVYHAPSHR